jgi:mannitol/fructose-specific phosphotransferase system IIA component (Ntr-type)/Kef-type K+ transport system membrane component KefB
MSLLPLGPANEIFSIGLLLIAGFAGGKVANTLKLPAITGNILAGILIGPYGLHLLSHQAVTIDLKPIMSFALAFVAFSIATHIDLREIRETNGQAFITGVFDVLVSSAAVTLALYFLTHSLILSLLLGVISGATAPATILAVIRETRSRGPLTSLLLPHVAINNLACVALFGFVFAGIKGVMTHGASITTALTHTALLYSLISILIGLGAGVALKVLFPRLEHETAILPLMLVSLLFVSGLSSFLHVSPLLAAMALGFLTHNLIQQKEAVDKAFFSLEPVIYTAFFTLAGAHLRLSLLPAVGTAGVVYILSRFAGKWLGTFFSGWACGASAIFRNVAGLALLPQAGIALGLIVLIQEEACCSRFSPTITAIVVAAVTIHEIVGPVLAKITLKVAGEAGKDLRPVMGFLIPEGVHLNLRAKDKWEAIDRLVEHLSKIYKLTPEEREMLLNSVIERERSMTTGIGHSLAIPHGVLEGSGPIMGVMGISKEGVDFEAVDGKKAHIVLLTAVHGDQLASHLEVLMKISRAFSQEGLTQKLLRTNSTVQIYKILYECEWGS